MKKLGNELTLIQLMTDGNDYTAEDLCNHLGCTRRNLYYYLQFLREYGFGVLRNENYYSLDVNSPFITLLIVPSRKIQRFYRLKRNLNVIMIFAFSQILNTRKSSCAI